MSTYNVLQVSAACPACGDVQSFEIQFSFGDVWQHHYLIGDRIRWGGNDVGIRGVQEVLVDGVGGQCSSCGEMYKDFEIRIEGDVITGATPASQPQKVNEEGFRVIRE